MVNIRDIDKGVYSGPTLGFCGAGEEYKLIDAFRGCDYSVGVVDELIDHSNIFDVNSREFDFPDYFGENWEALYDCLTDAEENYEKGFVLIVKRGAEFWRNDLRLAAKYSELWQEASNYWRKYGKYLIIIFIM